MSEIDSGAPAPVTEVVAEGQFQEAAPEVVIEGAEGVEVKAEEKSPPVQEDPKMAQRFAALSRKERQIRERERALQQQMNELQKRMQEMESSKPELEKYKSIPDRIKREPIKVLEEYGLTVEQLTEMMLNGGKPTPDMLNTELERKVQSRIEELEKKLQEKEQKEIEQKYEQQLQTFVNELTKFANDTPDYELIRANDAVDLVYQVIEQHHSETGEILSNKDACDAVEEYLLNEAKKLVDREKVKKLLGVGSEAKPATAPGKASPTLSNTQAAQVPTKGQRKLSNEESIAEAAKLIRWED